MLSKKFVAWVSVGVLSVATIPTFAAPHLARLAARKGVTTTPTKAAPAKAATATKNDPKRLAAHKPAAKTTTTKVATKAPVKLAAHTKAPLAAAPTKLAPKKLTASKPAAKTLTTSKHAVVPHKTTTTKAPAHKTLAASPRHTASDLSRNPIH
jgi:hypothetical protein